MLPDPRMYEMPDVPRNNRIKYLNDEAPDFTLPEPRGEHEARMMPATLDIQERARLGISAMTSATDPEADYELYWLAHFECNPPAMRHTSDDQVQIKFFETLPLLRHITGCMHNCHVDRRTMEAFLRSIDTGDGVHYWAAEGRPWHIKGSASVALNKLKAGERTWQAEGEKDTPPSFGFHTSLCTNGVKLGVLTLLYQMTGDKVWEEYARKSVDALGHFMTENEDTVSVTGAWGARGQPPTPRDNRIWDVQDTVWCIEYLPKYYQLTGYEPAMNLARKIRRTFLDDSFSTDGEFTSYNHFHMHTRALMGCIEQAIVDEDDDLWEFVRKGYEFGRGKGVPETGYFPEYYDPHPTLSTCELCETAEMIDLALWLSRKGVGDYWDDADRYIRNQFAGAQLIDTDFIYRTTAPLAPSRYEPVNVNWEKDVPERNVGAFAGWATGSQWGGNIMHCCTANATRALYFIYDSIVTDRNDAVQINLLLNHVTPDVTVMSHIPYTGRVDVEVKRRKRVSLRLAEGVDAKDARVTVDGADLSARVDGRYLDFGDVDAGKTITVTFPLETEIKKVWVQKTPYRYRLKGTTIVEAFPREELGDLYNRVHYRHPHALWKETDLFLPEEKLDWSPRVDG